MNVFRTDNRAEVWLRLDEDCDIHYVDCASLGVFPDWLDSEVDCVGWNDLVTNGLMTGWDMPGESQWALENGLCPGQKFKIRLRIRWWRSPATPNGPEEWDSETDVEIIEREPISAAEAADRWAEVLAR